MNPPKSGPVVSNEAPASNRRDTLTITDNRNGRQYEVPIKNETIRAIDLRPIKLNDADFGMMSYDPAFTNTASCTSKITYIDGDAGILRYRGYSIEELAEKSTYLETAYLILHGELPTKSQLSDWAYHITHHTFIHESIKKFLDGFHYDAHPMGMLISTVAALSTFYPDAKDIFNPGLAPQADLSPDRQDADARCICLPAQPRDAVRLPRQRSELLRQFSEYAVPYHRSEIPPESDARTRARHSFHPARGPRTELLVDGDARRGQLARGPLFARRRRPRPRSTARCMAARTKRCCACWSKLVR